MYYVVTGACGFIGANLVKALNERGVTDIIAVDNLTQADKFRNLTDCEIADYLDKREFLDLVEHGQLDGGVEAILHQGACSDTMETDGRYMMANNYRYSLALLDFCTEQEIPFLYASSASVYGGGSVFREEREFEAPLNVYGYSKFLFDQVVRRRLASADSDFQIAGFRYFNVYGPREQHKGRMASVAFHHFNQYRAEGKVKLFEGYGGYGAASSAAISSMSATWSRSTWISSKADVRHLQPRHRTRAELQRTRRATVNACRALEGKPALTVAELVAQGIIEYIAFPEALKGKYQSFTEADLAIARSRLP
jgi:ADP-L-glycero-D-manno-heptose 6-epimerase